MIKDEWAKWQPSIDKRALTGKLAKPPIASRLVRDAHDVTEFVELNPAMAVEHLNKVRSAVEILQQVASMQEGRIARAAQISERQVREIEDRLAGALFGRCYSVSPPSRDAYCWEEGVRAST